MKRQEWLEARRYTPEMLAVARQVLEEVRQGRNVLKAIQHNPLPKGGHVAKHVIVAVYRQLVESGEWEADPALLARIRMKPVRSLSGVTTVTVLTAPHECPGECIFCPDDKEMPKSYLADEPAAARAHQNNFDPYEQVQTRLQSLSAVGHPTDKIELLILGGSWSAYPQTYQEWFIKRCFDALNEEETGSLEEAQRLNEKAPHRNVGLSIETRPDEVTPQMLADLRRLGVTKMQIGVQSLDDRLLLLNHRGHTVAETRKACAMLRAAGYKLLLHWMPNLLGATLESDHEDYARLWAPVEEGGGFCPDELKIYPTQLLQNAPLYQYWLDGKYQPYTTEELTELLADIKPTTPVYCRINRVIRDIPSNHVVAGNRRTSLRQDVLREVERRGQVCNCIRCREVRKQKIDPETLTQADEVYYPADAEEHFISYNTPEGKLAGYLRLSLPKSAQLPPDLFKDLQGAAVIREVHVYGQSLPIGKEQQGAAQHVGLGTSLIEEAARLSAQRGYKRLAVIAAIGTRLYYESRGFERGELYMVRQL